ncbi:hypothetical protein DPMN_042258 [Dreissena polymorpha]|uniref:Uncharacterized protein n=1 Tax=Dreissena polymorpha TaxID=45954 RepID=A0A9D4D1R7_DREPO|nr:hypothetical protein DPMN_042258 [Dreissena polymorpha]
MSSACNVRSDDSPVLTTDMRIVLSDLVRQTEGIIHEINNSIELIHGEIFSCATARSDDTFALLSQLLRPAGPILILGELDLAYNISRVASNCFRNILGDLDTLPGYFAELKPFLWKIERNILSFACQVEIGMKALNMPIPLQDWAFPIHSCETPLIYQADLRKTVEICKLLVNKYKIFTVINHDLFALGQDM